MLGCDCQSGQGHGTDEALQALPVQLAGASNESLSFYIAGVRTGLAIRQADNAKWTRLGIILALTFGTLTFMGHLNK